MNLPSDPFHDPRGGPLFLVPTERHVELELAAREADGGSPERVHIETWAGFQGRALRELTPDITLATPQATRLAAREALALLDTNQLGDLGDPAARASMANIIDSSLGRLRRSGVAPHHLRGLSAPQAPLLAEAMDRVDEILTRARLLDPRGAGQFAARRLRALGGGAARELAVSAATVKGMVAWEVDDLAWIEALHAQSRAEDGIGATLVLPRLGDGDDALAPIADALERRWAALTDAPEIDWAKAQGSAPIEVIRARSPEAEARATAAACLTALQRGTPPERVAILIPELDEAVLEPLRAALNDAKITFTEPAGRPLAASPEARAALTLLEIAEGPVRRESVTDLLRSPGIDAAFWGAKADARSSSIAHRLREVPVEIDRTGRQLVEGLAAASKGRPDDAWMTQSLSRLMASARWLAEGGSWGETARRYASLLDQMGLGKPTPRDLAAAIRTHDRGGSALALRAIAEGSLSTRALMDLVRSIAAAAAELRLSERPCTPGELKMEIERASEGASVLAKGTSARTAAVRIARPADLCGVEHDVAIVMCLQVHAYGGAAPEDALIDERLRAELPTPLRPASMRERDAWRRAELAWALAGARDVVLSFAPGDESELAEPHPMVVSALRRGARRREEPASRVAPHASRLNRRGAELIALSAGAAPEGSVAARAQIELDRAAFFLDPAAPAGDFTGKVRLRDEAVRSALIARVGGASADKTIAVTQIERAAECAFAGFARRVLRARRSDDLAESADARERGTLVHRALHAAFDAIKEAGAPDDPAALLAIARAGASLELGAARAMAPLRREAIERAIESALSVVVKTIESGDPVRFALAERRFGPSEAEPWGALELAADADLPGPSVFVDGQIDRIDLATDRRIARVIDYKSSLPTAAERKRGAFQLPLYAAVAQRALSAASVHRLYVAVRKRGEIEEWPRDPADHLLSPDDIATAVREARQVVLGLWEGDVKPRPARASLCDRCDARDVCRRPAIVPVDDAQGDEGA